MQRGERERERESERERERRRDRERGEEEEEEARPGALRTFSLILLGLTFFAGVVAMTSLSTVPMKRCSDWVWKDTVPLGSFLMRTAWFLWADSMSWGTDTQHTEPSSDGGAAEGD